MSGDSPNKFGRTTKKAGKGAAILSAKHDTEGGLTLSQKAETLKIEAAIRNRKTEVAYAVNAQGKSVRLSEKGSDNRTHIDIKKLHPGDILIHNHPATQAAINGDLASNMGLSLSGADLATAISNNAGGIRASAPNYQYSIRPGKSGWGANWRTIEAEFKTHYNKISRRENARIKDFHASGQRRAFKENLSQKEVDKLNNRLRTMQNRRDAVASHYAMKQLAKKYGWTYTHKSIKQ